MAYIGEAASDYQCDLQISHYSPATRDELHDFFRKVRADGLIFIGPGLLHPHLEEASKTRSDFVVWGAKLDDQHYPLLGSDNVLGGFKAANHLKQIGRKHIHFLGDTTGPEMRLRFEGFASATGHEPSSNLPLLHSCDLDIASAIAMSQHLIEEGVEIDGIVAVNDVVALGAVIGLQRRGIRVPDDVAVVGYDDIELCRYAHPTLSSVSQNAPIAGKTLVSKLFADSKRRLLSELLTTDLVVRESSSFLNPSAM